MITEATRQIIAMAEIENDRKQRLRRAVGELEERKRQRQSEIATDQLRVMGLDDSSTDYYYSEFTNRLWRIIVGISRIMEIERQLSDTRKNFAKVDKAISETIHWTGMSEHENQEDRQEALSRAEDVLNKTLSSS